jgi:PKD repeat protein
VVNGGPPGGVGFVDVPYTFEAAAIACVPDPVWNWSASGGGQVFGTGDTVAISWPTPGAKSVTASNNGCAAPPATTNVEIQDAAAAVAGVGVDPAAPSICETVTFTAEDVTGLPPFVDDWEVRNGAGALVASGTGTDLSFEWMTDDTTPTGPYTATVVVSNVANPGGDMASAGFTLADAVLEFTELPTYDGAPGAGVIDVPVQFRVVTAGASSWTWDFGDGTTPVTFTSRAAGENPLHTYTLGGSYDVTVTIENCAGGFDTTGLSIEIVEEELQVVTFRPICPFGICEFECGETVGFLQDYQGQPQTYSYDWNGDGTFDQTSATVQATHVYHTAGAGFQPRVKVVSGTQEITYTSPSSMTVFDVGCDAVDLPIFTDGFESGDLSAWTLQP